MPVLSISTLTAWFSVWVYRGCHQHPDQLSLVSPDSLGGSWLSTDKMTHKIASAMTTAPNRSVFHPHPFHLD
ncbi:hypothetical protein ASPTUDRAFT_402971 [Aspergillus tubingensis CBS 134.48]|uniref:Uncharacterized protein n=1 Tax=Aspergillus tubingensis (strain CBS 134.48) TaxID=767770 RepID=A0A1L9NFR0_ASPTC|nr:hypothetical protein ASPTUDRAFT_402971 [Aspergillus tubingensis CBS 134.48]